jgi:hypothetical protein
VTSTFKFFRTDQQPKDSSRAVLQIAFDGALKTGLNEVERRVDLSKLDAGRYRLEVTVTDTRAKITVTQSSPIVLR